MVQFRSNTRFSFLNPSPDTPSLTRNGREVWGKLFERDRNLGGYFSEIVGLMGSGKTSLMFTICDKGFSENPKEKFFLREPESVVCQFPKLKSNVEVFVDSRFPLGLFELKEGEPLFPVDDFKIHRFRGVQELMKKTKVGQINVVYFKPDELYKWCHVLDKLRLDSGWESCFWDEAEDIFPLNGRGLFYDANQMFSNAAKQIRKARVNLTYNTQNSHDCDWRLRYKIMLWFYLRGSRVDPLSPIFQGAVSKLGVGQCYVDLMRGQFGVLRFAPYLPGEREFIMLPVPEVKRL